MAVVKGVKELVHQQLYDAVFVKPGRRLGEILTSNVLRFFQDVTGKTKLLTNMQAASLLPHWNTYEAHALRVVISDLPPVVSENVTIRLEVFVVDCAGQPSGNRKVELGNFKLTHFVEFTRRIESSELKALRLSRDELKNLGLTVEVIPPDQTDPPLAQNEFVEITRTTLKEAVDKFGRDVIPTTEQIFPNNGFGGLIGKFIYNTVTTFNVGEKIMCQVPTRFLPAGAGPYSGDSNVTTQGYQSQQATFRFAYAVKIDAQQNFRV